MGLFAEFLFFSIISRTPFMLFNLNKTLNGNRAPGGEEPSEDCLECVMPRMNHKHTPSRNMHFRLTVVVVLIS